MVARLVIYNIGEVCVKAICYFVPFHRNYWKVYSGCWPMLLLPIRIIPIIWHKIWIFIFFSSRMTLFSWRMHHGIIFCSIKSVLHGFELASGLCVNFHKSNIMGINVNQDFLHTASDFFSCLISLVPFVFLGIPIDINPHRRSSWVLVLEKLRRKLAVWKGKQISMAGRVTFINSMLAYVPLFVLSFHRTTKLVVQEIINIQKYFLWSGEENRRWINWVSWDHYYK